MLQNSITSEAEEVEICLFKPKTINWLLLDNLCQGISHNELSSFLNEKDDAMQALDFIDNCSMTNDEDIKDDNNCEIEDDHYYRYNSNVLIVSNQSLNYDN